jgi:Tol biopolymer transport system component
MLTRLHAGPLLAAISVAGLSSAVAAHPDPAPVEQADLRAAPDRLTLDAYLDIETVSDPQLSPDASQIVYTRGWIDKVNDRRESALWIMAADGSRNRFLVKGSGARWSPTGDRIAYIASGEPKGSQIFVRWMDAEGAISQVTRVDQSPASIAWSPDGTQLSFAMLVEDTNTWAINLPKPPRGTKWTEPPHIVERLTYRSDRSGFIDNGYQHIFVVPAIGGTPRALTDGKHNHTGTEWTPDGQQILFSGLRSDTDEYQWGESEIYAVDVKTGAIRQLTTRKGPDGNPSVSPDGRLVAYTGNDWSRDTWKDTCGQSSS